MINSFYHFTLNGRDVVKFRSYHGAPSAFLIKGDKKILGIYSVDSGDAVNVINQDDLRSKIIETIRFL